MAEIQIYDSFYSDVIYTCKTAYDFSITQSINEDFRMVFSVPILDTEINKYVKAGNTIIYNGQKFRIVKVNKESAEDGSRKMNVTALFYYYTDLKIIKPKFGDYYGYSVASVINKIFAETPYNMEVLITDKIDFEIVDLKNLKELVDLVIEKLGYGEIQFNGNELILRETVGMSKSVALSLDSNCTSITREDDTSNMVTRLFPYGADNVGIESLQSSGCIASDNLNVYGWFDGTRVYNELKTPEEIIRRAWWEFDPTNVNRIDVPETTISVRYIDLSYTETGLERLDIGDMVTIYDKAIGTMGEFFRIKQITKYPDEPEKNEIVLGKLKGDIFRYVKKMNRSIKNFSVVANGQSTEIEKQIKRIAGSGGGMKKLIVDALPTEDIDENTVYFLKKTIGEEGDLYEEYLYIDDKWEKFGRSEGGSGSNIIALDHEPTEAEILAVENGAVIYVYDVNNPYIPTGE